MNNFPMIFCWNIFSRYCHLIQEIKSNINLFRSETNLNFGKGVYFNSLFIFDPSKAAKC